jgi:hypothetical protein
MNITNHQKKIALDESGLEFIIINLDIDDSTNKIVNFCIIQVTGKPERPVIKYDSAHGYTHIHKYYTSQKEPEESEKPVNFETIREIRQDIYENWKKYRAKMILKED